MNTYTKAFIQQGHYWKSRKTYQEKTHPKYNFIIPNSWDNKIEPT